MYAIINEGGGQRKVTQGEEILIDLVQGGEIAAGQTLTISEVLVLGGDGGAKIGKPFVGGAQVTLEVVEPLVKDDKIVIWHFGAKKGWRRKKGHRQKYTKVRVTGIKG